MMKVTSFNEFRFNITTSQIQPAFDVAHTMQSTSAVDENYYTLFHRECGHPRHLVRCDRIQLLVVVEIISEVCKVHDRGDEGVHTVDGTEYSNDEKQLKTQHLHVRMTTRTNLSH